MFSCLKHTEILIHKYFVMNKFFDYEYHSCMKSQFKNNPCEVDGQVNPKLSHMDSQLYRERERDTVHTDVLCM